MARKVRCPNPSCGRQFTLADEPTRQALRCVYCGAKLAPSGSGERARASTASQSGIRPAAAAQVVRELAEALEYARGLGIVHRLQERGREEEARLVAER